MDRSSKSRQPQKVSLGPVFCKRQSHQDAFAAHSCLLPSGRSGLPHPGSSWDEVAVMQDAGMTHCDAKALLGEFPGVFSHLHSSLLISLQVGKRSHHQLRLAKVCLRLLQSLKCSTLTTQTAHADSPSYPRRQQ